MNTQFYEITALWKEMSESFLMRCRKFFPSHRSPPSNIFLLHGVNENNQTSRSWREKVYFEKYLVYGRLSVDQKLESDLCWDWE